jgi:HEAT repeat protein
MKINAAALMFLLICAIPPGASAQFSPGGSRGLTYKYKPGQTAVGSSEKLTLDCGSEEAEEQIKVALNGVAKEKRRSSLSMNFVNPRWTRFLYDMRKGENVHDFAEGTNLEGRLEAYGYDFLDPDVLDSVVEAASARKRSRVENWDRIYAVDALGISKCPGALEPFVELYGEELGFQLRRVLGKAIASIDEEAAIYHMSGDLESRDIVRRSVAMESLGGVDDEEIAGEITAAAFGEDWFLRMSVYRAMEKMSYRFARPTIIELLTEREYFLRAAGLEIARGIVSNGQYPHGEWDGELVEILLEMMESDDSMNPSNAAILLASLVTGSLAEKKEGVLPRDDLTPTLAAFIHDEEAPTCVRFASAEALVRMGWGEEYEEAVRGPDASLDADLYFVYILQGLPESEALLAKAMEEDGTAEMQYAFRHSGHGVLERVARRRIFDRNYLEMVQVRRVKCEVPWNVRQPVGSNE